MHAHRPIGLMLHASFCLRSDFYYSQATLELKFTVAKILEILIVSTPSILIVQLQVIHACITMAYIQHVQN